MSTEDQNLIHDAAMMANAKRTPCSLCGKLCDEHGFPVVIANRVYCRVCWFNAISLIETENN